jgi:hypothetical protein
MIFLSANFREFTLIVSKIRADWRRLADSLMVLHKFYKSCCIILPDDGLWQIRYAFEPTLNVAYNWRG